MIQQTKFCKLFLSLFLYLFLYLAFFTLFPIPVIADQPTRSAYTVGPGDIITLTIFAGGIQQAKTDIVVSDKGDLTVPFIGDIKASGLTLKDLEKKIYGPLEQDYFVSPQINIQMKEYHSLSYTISGAVKKEGKYELDFHPSLMDLIAKAGGVSKERGNIAYILRSNKAAEKDPINIDLSKLLDEGDMSRNIMLETGDTIYIPNATQMDQARTKIYLEGEIKNPGMIDYQPGLTALSACIMAGGFGKYAAPARARIIRIDQNTHEIIKINLDEINAGNQPDFPLKPGDRIHIPETWL